MNVLNREPGFYRILDQKYQDTEAEDCINFPMDNTERMDPTVRLKRKLAEMQIVRDSKALHLKTAAEDYGLETAMSRTRYYLGKRQRQEIVDLDRAIRALNNKLNQKVTLRDAYKPRFKTPRDDIGHEIDEFNIIFDRVRKNVEKADGTKSSVEQCWKKLHRAGLQGLWSHDNYKDALGRMLIGEAYDCYEDFADEPLESILKELSNRFGARQMFQSISKLETFCRNPNELLDAAFGRLRGLINHVLPTIREEDRTQKVEAMKMQALMNITSPSAMTRINDIIADAVQAGDIATYEDLLSAAQSAEMANRDVPKVKKDAYIRIFAQPMMQDNDSSVSHTVINAIDPTTGVVSGYQPPAGNNFGAAMSRSDSKERQARSPKPAMTQRASAATEDRRARSSERQSTDRTSRFNRGRDLTPARPKERDSSTDRLQKDFSKYVDWSKQEAQRHNTSEQGPRQPLPDHNRSPAPSRDNSAPRFSQRQRGQSQERETRRGLEQGQQVTRDRQQEQSRDRYVRNQQLEKQRASQAQDQEMRDVQEHTPTDQNRRYRPRDQSQEYRRDQDQGYQRQGQRRDQDQGYQTRDQRRDQERWNQQQDRKDQLQRRQQDERQQRSREQSRDRSYNYGSPRDRSLSRDAGRYQQQYQGRSPGQDRSGPRNPDRENDWGRQRQGQSQGQGQSQQRGRSRERGPWQPTQGRQDGARFQDRATSFNADDRSRDQGRTMDRFGPNRDNIRSRDQSYGRPNQEQRRAPDCPYNHKNTTYVFDANTIMSRCEACSHKALVTPTLYNHEQLIQDQQAIMDKLTKATQSN